MTEYFQLPSIVNSIEQLGDGSLKSFLQEYDEINNNQFSIDSLRVLYKEDKKRFIQIVDELALRGFYFYYNKPNNIFPSREISFDEYIWSTEDRGHFRNLNFEKLGMSGFVHRFQIKSDTFFHKIPLEGFKRLKRNLDLKMFKSELLRAGFVIEDPQNVQMSETVSEFKVGGAKVQSEVDIGTSSDNLNKQVLEKAQPRLNKALSNSQSIDDIFSEFKYGTFRSYCKKNGIDTVDKLTEKHILNYGTMKGVGIGKVEGVRQLMNKCLDVTEGLPLDTDPGNSLDIDKVFYENTYRSFRKFCNLNNIKNIQELTSGNFEEFGQMHGVGIGKIEAVKQRVSLYLSLYGGTAFNSESKEEVPPSPTFTFNLSVSANDINDVFIERKFNLFRKFCAENHIKTLGQLQPQHIESFRGYDMVGKKRVDEVLQVVNYYIDSGDEHTVFSNRGIIYDEIKGIEVSKLFKVYGYQTCSQSNIKIMDIEGKDFSELKEEFELDFLLDLYKNLQKQKLPKEIVTQLKSSIPERTFSILEHRFDNGETLEEIGACYDVTRERVRQILKKGVTKVIGLLNKENFPEIVQAMSVPDIFIIGKDLINLVGSENMFLINMLKQENSLFNYFEKLDAFFFNMEGSIDLKRIEVFLEELPELFNIYEYQQALKEILEDIGIEDLSLEIIERLFESEGYTKQGDFYSSHRISINEVMTCLFKYYINGSLRVDEKGVAHLRTLAKRHLNFDLGSSIRSVDARIRDAENLILVDKATFQHFDSEKFDKSIILKIEEYLDEEFKKHDVINVERIFQSFQEDFRKIGVQNKLYLYSLIQYFLGEKYIIGQGNTLNIFRNEKSKLSAENQLILFMKKNDGLCSKEQLLEVMRPMYKIDVVISSSEKIIPWGNNQVIMVEKLKINPNEKKQLIDYFNLAFQKGYTTSSYMFNEMIFDRKLSILLRAKGIDEPAKLVPIIKLFLPNVKGHTNFLFLEGCEIDNFEKVIIEHFDGETSRQEIKEFAQEYGYKEMMSFGFLKRLLEQEAFVEIDVDQLYNARMLKVDDASMNEIAAYAEEEMGSNEFLSISILRGYRRRLPSIGLRWNAYLLNTLLQRCGFRQVKKIYNDYRYDKILVVKKESHIETFEDLVIHLIETEYSGNMHEIGIYDFLAEKGVLNEQQYIHKKVLPYEIKMLEKFNFDEQGYVIRQGK